MQKHMWKPLILVRAKAQGDDGRADKVSLRSRLIISRPAWGYNAAMISKELMDILVCPVCKKPLAQNDDGPSLKCAECRRVYPIRDGIPIMLVDEATIAPS
jgi:uncharacterized protein